MKNILTDKVASLTELRQPNKLIECVEDEPIAILNRNEPVAYMVSPALFEYLMEKEDDIYLTKLAKEALAKGEKPVRVKLDEL